MVLGKVISTRAYIHTCTYIYCIFFMPRDLLWLVVQTKYSLICNQKDYF